LLYLLLLLALLLALLLLLLAPLRGGSLTRLCGHARAHTAERDARAGGIE
jgi:hypothetical protein